jgi:hypothetical protein
VFPRHANTITAIAPVRPADNVRHNNYDNFIRFEVLTAVTIKNAILWHVTPCGSYENRRFGGTSVLTRATWHNIQTSLW